MLEGRALEVVSNLRCRKNEVRGSVPAAILCSPIADLVGLSDSCILDRIFRSLYGSETIQPLLMDLRRQMPLSVVLLSSAANCPSAWTVVRVHFQMSIEDMATKPGEQSCALMTPGALHPDVQVWVSCFDSHLVSLLGPAVLRVVSLEVLANGTHFNRERFVAD